MPADPDQPSGAEPEASEAMSDLRTGLRRLHAIVDRARERLDRGGRTPAEPSPDPDPQEPPPAPVPGRSG